MFERISAIIVDRLEDKRIIQMETKEVCAYGLRQIFSTILNAGTMLLIGVFMHMTIEAILFTIAYIPIRIFFRRISCLYSTKMLGVFSGNVVYGVMYCKIYTGKVLLASYSIIAYRQYRYFFTVTCGGSKQTLG